MTKMSYYTTNLSYAMTGHDTHVCHIVMTRMRVTSKNGKYIKNNKLVFFPYLIFETQRSTPN